MPHAHFQRDRMATTMKAKLTEWFWRYLPLEIVSIVTALIGAFCAAKFTDSAVAIAFAGTWGENVGYYAYAVMREYKPGVSIPKMLRNLLVEFGVPETIDSFVVRPAFMFAGQEYFGSIGWGIAAGKIAADVVFYALVVGFYEARKKFLD
jgi:hypothetical protein